MFESHFILKSKAGIEKYNSFRIVQINKNNITTNFALRHSIVLFFFNGKKMSSPNQKINNIIYDLDLISWVIGGFQRL